VSFFVLIKLRALTIGYQEEFSSIDLWSIVFKEQTSLKEAVWIADGLLKLF
jgi:hypothetical protein